jgi:hypothetical protein
VKIKCHNKFLDGSDSFEAQDIRTVDDTRGQYFISQGWATELGAETQLIESGDVNLTIQSSSHATGDSNG